ncbi:helix-turn-helix domain-containing protein [Paenibacillus radicis (ex Xue et al. 2023)]|uniref:Helix-turn-helix domain-containing protein n=1 Tax=Paenibacillus radicis (ex Xue et al. 2023) TaxID=2972489 RepID=A0ABT1YJR7_9BACL|nr:helix-turn-helix transcriptional regulator [Paenibacillus radicis (ex Xue et al. 2023)]MCR8633207.1 helix-turn-helix domain-containing protein [Paenibacillus radicis (ex Xue et al. 2023)]
MMSVTGDRIKTLRKEKGLKQRELGDRLGVSPQVISNWERNYSFPDHNDIVQLAQIFGTTADHLLGRVDNIFHEQLDISRVYMSQQSKNDKGVVTIDLIKLFNSDFGVSINGSTLSLAEKSMLESLTNLFFTHLRAIKDEH